MRERNLIIIHRGPDYVRDFEEVAQRISAIEPGITVVCIDSRTTRVMPEEAWSRPTLTVALMAKFRADIRRGPVLANRAIHKTGQHRIFMRAGLPTPPTVRFTPGMKLDPIMFGELVVIKPTSPDLASYGRGIQLFRRKRLETMSFADFPRDHLIHRDRSGFIVQRFVDTGPLLRMFRVQTFFGVPLYCWAAQETAPRPPLGGTDEEIENACVVSNAGQDRARWLCADADVLALGSRVGKAFADIPILGIDIIPEARTGKLFVLECNPGGNTWHFSAGSTAEIRQQFGGAHHGNRKTAEEAGRRAMIEQFGAFDRVADVLVRKVRELAS